MTTLKELINTMFSRNEAKPSEIYVISNAEKADSGWSFGQCQWDLSHYRLRISSINYFQEGHDEKWF